MVLGDFSRIKWEKARFFKQKGQYREAEEQLKEALDDDSENLLLRASLAEVYLRQDKSLEARILADSILSVDPHYSKALYLLGEIALKEKRLDEALASFRQAADHNPAPYLTLRVVRTLREMRRYDQALETLDAVLLKDKTNLLLLKEKALILNRVKRLDEALSIYERIEGLDPRNPFVRKEIYRLRGLKRQDQKVIRELETVVNLPSRKDAPQPPWSVG